MLFRSTRFSEVAKRFAAPQLLFIWESLSTIFNRPDEGKFPLKMAVILNPVHTPKSYPMAIRITCVMSIRVYLSYHVWVPLIQGVDLVPIVVIRVRPERQQVSPTNIFQVRNVIWMDLWDQNSSNLTSGRAVACCDLPFRVSAGRRVFFQPNHSAERLTVVHCATFAGIIDEGPGAL